MPRALPEDLFTEQIGRDLRGHLDSFREGRMSRQAVHAAVRHMVDTALNTIASHRGAEPNVQDLDEEAIDLGLNVPYGC